MDYFAAVGIIVVGVVGVIVFVGVVGLVGSHVPNGWAFISKLWRA